MFTSAKSYDVNAPVDLPPPPPASDIWWWSLETCSNLFNWGPIPPPVTSGGNWNLSTYGLQGDSIHPAGMLSCLVGQPMTNQVSWLQLLIIRVICTTKLYPVVHPGFLRQGWGPKPIIWQGFCEKLHENVRNWAERGMARVPSDPLPPDLASCSSHYALVGRRGVATIRFHS